MRRLRIFSLSLFLFALGAYAVPAQEISLLSPEHQAKLTDQAQLLYHEGEQSYNYVDYDGALNFFYQAMQANPKDVKLRLQVGRFAMERGKLKQGDDALRLFNIAREAYQGALALPGILADDKHIAETDLKTTQQLIDDQPKRDTRRQATGQQIITEVAQEREQFAQQPLTPLGLPGATGGTGAASGGAGATGATGAAGASTGNAANQTNTKGVKGKYGSQR